MADLYAASELDSDEAAGPMAQRLAQLHARWADAGGEGSLGGQDLGCVLPLPRLGMWPWQVWPHHCCFAGALRAEYNMRQDTERMREEILCMER